MGGNRKIGIIDSGIGGLTVVKAFEELLPKESIIYFGDNKNVPYGNKTEEEIYKLAKNMIDFLIEKDVKLVVVACNTISSILNKYFSDYKIPIISIIEPVTDYVIKKDYKQIGIIATNFTIKSGIYENLIKEKNKNISIISEPSPRLARIIDRGDYNKEEVEDIIKNHINSILKYYNIKDIILGCTHYPIVLDKFQKVAPDINFIDPAYKQVIYIKKLINKNNLKGNRENSTFEIYTTGEKDIYFNIIKALSLKNPDNIKTISNF